MGLGANIKSAGKYGRSNHPGFIKAVLHYFSSLGSHEHHQGSILQDLQKSVLN